jgi:PucR family transcriptional regulator, purine catabolism regulatory protein
MPLTLREFLELDVIKRGEAEVVAGAAYLDRRIRWAHISELPDVAYLLKGGELLLTTGINLKAEKAQQRLYIRELAEAGVAALVVELGRAFMQLPETMVHEAERCQLPLIALHRETRYVEVTEQVHAAIINRQFELLQKAEAIGRDFTDLVLACAGLKRMLYRLSAIVENPVVLEDAAHQVVEFVARAGPVEDTLGAWERHSRRGHEQLEPSLIHDETDAEPACIWAAVWFRGEPWGRLHVLRVESALAEIDRLALDRAVAAVGLTLLSEQDAAHVADDARSVLISDILHGRYGSPDEVFRRAKNLGANLEGRTLAAMVIDPWNLATLADERGLSEQERQRIRATIVSETRQGPRAAECTVLCGLEGGRVFALLGLLPGKPIDATLGEVAKIIHASVARRVEGLELVIGTGGQVHPESLPRAFDEAKEAARYGAKVGRPAPLYRFGDLGLHQLLLRLAEGPDLARFVETELRPLLEHDARSSFQLVPTLRAYLDHGGRKSDAARALHIERRTLYHRLERIEDILGRTLEDQEIFVRLTLALRGLDLLRTPKEREDGRQRRRRPAAAAAGRR